MKIHDELDQKSLYESIVDNSDDAIISKALDGTILSWNKGAEKIFGYNQQEMIGKHISSLVPPSRANEDREIIERIRNGEAIHHYETERVRKDGAVITISLTVSPLKNKEGKIIGASKIARDITDHQLRMDKLVMLIKEIADYKYALDESCIVAVTDQKGIISYVNEYFCKISGYSREELLGQDHRLINSGYHSTDFIRNLWVTIAGGKVWRGEIRNKTKNGSYYWVDTTIVPFLNERGKPFRYMSIRSDITDRKLSEEMNLRAQQKYQQVAENMLDGLLVTDLDGKITFTNKQFIQLFGLHYSNTEEFVLPETFADEFLNHIYLRANVQAVPGEHYKSIFDFEGKKYDGSKISLEVQCCHVLENNVVTGLQYAIKDITRQKSAEAMRTKVIEEIVARNKDLEQFSYIVSHNLRAPVANILGITDLFTLGDLNEHEKIFLLDSLIESTKKLDSIILDLNHVTQIKISSYENKEVVSFPEIIEDITISIRHIIDKNNVLIVHDFSEADSFLSVKSYLYSIFYNLITNSIKYKNPTHQLICTIKSRNLEKHLELTFSDNGIGIDLKHTGNQIFDIYKRFHMGIAEGRGLGLYMVKTHVESMGGTIEVRSEINIGTEFSITLPLST